MCRLIIVLGDLPITWYGRRWCGISSEIQPLLLSGGIQRLRKDSQDRVSVARVPSWRTCRWTTNMNIQPISCWLNIEFVPSMMSRPSRDEEEHLWTILMIHASMQGIRIFDRSIFQFVYRPYIEPTRYLCRDLWMCRVIKSWKWMFVFKSLRTSISYHLTGISS